MASSRRVIQRIPYLLVSDMGHASDLERVTTLLPLCAYGRVFVEVNDVSEQWDMPLPSWMTMNWLFSEPSKGRLPGAHYGCVSGYLAVRAARAWVNEVLCEPEPINQVRVWLGLEEGFSRRLYTYLVGAVGVPAEHVVRCDRRLPVT